MTSSLPVFCTRDRSGMNTPFYHSSPTGPCSEHGAIESLESMFHRRGPQHARRSEQLFQAWEQRPHIGYLKIRTLLQEGLDHQFVFFGLAGAGGVHES